jgi:phosphatidate cytidylyltransferase
MAPTLQQAGVRVLTSLVALPAFLALVWFEPLNWVFNVAIGVLAAVGLFEYYSIVRARQISPETIGGILAGTLVCLSGSFNDLTEMNFVLFGGCALVAALHIVRGQHSLAGLSSTVFGLFYIGWFGAHVLLLHRGAAGPALVTLLFVSVILTDTMAYAVGSLVGRHKMAPKASPGKSWEGAAAGLAGAVLGVAVLYYVDRRFALRLPDWTLSKYLFAGALLSAASQLGDLTESVLKRDAGVKDSGGFFPGHGGVLDRCDGFLFAAPVLYYLYVPLFGP